MSTTQMRTPLSRAKGWGSAKSGTHHFWVQRLTGIALIPLTLWFCFGLASLPSMAYSDFTAWVGSPFNSVMLILTLMAVFYHYALGLQVIIEDYVSDHAVRTAAIIASHFVCIILGVVGVFSVIRISLGVAG
ncbi:MAG: succinate dehydrogenase, hydrophobic membrane anchor protein [Pseudomonadota bacterium]